jgi:hypothetical protein
VTKSDDKTRAAMDALTGTIHAAPPLRLPAEPEGRPRLSSAARTRRARRWRTWGAPLTAAAAVLAIAVSLVIAKGIPNGPAAPPSASGSSAGVPTYYVALTQSGWYANAPLAGATSPSAPLVVGATLTGKRLATVQPPRGVTFTGLTAADDDQTFVVSATPAPLGRGLSGTTATRSWYLLRIFPGSAPAAQLTGLPIPGTSRGTALEGMALSPDGTELALALQPGASTANPGRELLLVYSVATGAVLRSWSGPAYTIADGVDPAVNGDDNTVMSWADNGRVLAFNYSWMTGPQAGPKGTPDRDENLAKDRDYHQVRTLDLASPGDDLLADSHVIWSTSGPALSTAATSPLACDGHLTITPDGSTLACAAWGRLRNPGTIYGEAECPAIAAWNDRGFLEYSATTGTLSRVIGTWQTSCLPGQEPAALLWAGASGTPLIGYMEDRPPSDASHRSSDIGIYTARGYEPLPNLPAGATAFTTVW